MSERYAAFISYSHSDEGVARWLHRGLEGYRFPKGLRGEASEFGPVPAKLPPVFRDRDELPASGDLGSELRNALAASRFQIVLCSPRAAQSKWVNEEILAFKRTHGEHRTLAVIVEGEPYSGGAQECFPEALRFKLAEDGSLSGEPAEPIAADIRKGKDGKRLALLKLLAGISGTRLDQLVRRDAARRQRRLAFVAAGSGLVALTTIGLAIYAESQRRVAVEQRDMAEASLAFLTGTFEIANPATENPKTITALTILGRASRSAEKEFANRPEIAASLLRTTGQIYYNLGLHDETRRDLVTALKLEKTPTGRARTLLLLAELAQRGQDLAAMRRYTAQAAAAYEQSDPGAEELNARLTEQRARNLFFAGEYGKSANLFQSAVGKFRTLPGDHRADLLDNLKNEAVARDHARQPSRADRVHAEAIHLAERTFGVNDIRTARAYQNRAVAALENGRNKEGEAQIDRTLAIYTRVLEREHPDRAAAELLLGRLASANGETAKATAAFARARAIFTFLYGPDNAAVGDTDFYTAEALLKAGRNREALERLKSVQRIYDLSYGAIDPDQVELALLRARVLSASGDRKNARIACLRAAFIQSRLDPSPAVLKEVRAACPISVDGD